MFRKGFTLIELLVILGGILAFIYWKMSGGSLFDDKTQKQNKMDLGNIQKVNIKENYEHILDRKLEYKIKQNIAVLQKNIRALQIAEMTPVSTICEILGKCTIFVCDTEQGKIAETNLWGKCVSRYENQYKIILSPATSMNDIKILSKTIQAKGIIKTNLNIIIKYKKERMKLYNYLADVNLIKSKLEVAKTMNSTKVLTTLQKQLIQLEHDIKKDLAKSNMR